MRAALLFAAVSCAAGPAMAELEVCNDIDAEISVAIGYRGDADWVSEGWWRVLPSACRTVIAAPLRRTHYYVRTTSPGREIPHNAYIFCTTAEAFTIEGDDKCVERGYRRDRFNEIALPDGIEAYVHRVADTLTDADAAPPGTHGEPYTVSGLLSHCEVTDASIQCEMHAPPFRYVASGHGPTDLALLEAMLDWPVNTPVTWTGDMTFFNGPNAEVTISQVTREGDDPFADVRRSLQGGWVSVDDAEYRLIVHGGVFSEWYGGVPTDTRILEIADRCFDLPDSSPVLITHSGQDEPPQCYGLSNIGTERLELYPAGVMRPLSFRRTAP